MYGGVGATELCLFPYVSTIGGILGVSSYVGVAILLAKIYIVLSVLTV